MSNEKNILVDKDSEENSTETARDLLNQLDSLQKELNKMRTDFNNSAELIKATTKNKLSIVNRNLNNFGKSLSEFIGDSETILEKNDKDIK